MTRRLVPASGRLARTPDPRLAFPGMPQLLEYPYLPPGEPHGAVNALIRMCRDLPPEGERFPDFRTRMKDLRLWDPDRMSGTYAFFGIERTGLIGPSPLMRRVRAT